jgi:hypothetical protein
MRPPSPRPAHRSAVVAAILLVAGYVCLRLADQENVLLVLGLVAVTIGLLFLGPLAIRVAAAAGPRLLVAARLSLRDLARHQARSGTALAAISLALAVPAFVVVVTAANATPAVANLSDRQLMIRTGEPGTVAIPDRTPTQVAAVERAVREFAGTLGTPTVIGLDVAMDPAARSQPGIGGGQSGRTPVLTGIVVRDSQNRITGIHALGHGQGARTSLPPSLRGTWGSIPRRSIAAPTYSPLLHPSQWCFSLTPAGSPDASNHRQRSRRCSRDRPMPRCPPSCLPRPPSNVMDGRRYARAGSSRRTSHSPPNRLRRPAQWRWRTA